ncbi:hypothetical protein VC83_00604 [Pseudogymnoascus destructans]|uniref:Uncharacterized protein n=1 Tax=Pseudogymnoascus destructans TaxID=655981 RepID=A0A177ALW5_9PEZI|nr:uncharacterized protein VC83_00604 [Pseudogymnoascus destructans]OAF63057.1 hypothetical protein VC83_00604 [Pseudogymnoascus destructans]
MAHVVAARAARRTARCGDHCDVQAAGAIEKDYFATTILQIKSTNRLNHLEPSALQPVPQHLKPPFKHSTKHPEIMYGICVRARWNCSPCCCGDDYYTIRLTTGTGAWRRNGVLRSYEEEEYYLCRRDPWRSPSLPPRRRVRFARF